VLVTMVAVAVADERFVASFVLAAEPPDSSNIGCGMGGPGLGLRVLIVAVSAARGRGNGPGGVPEGSAAQTGGGALGGGPPQASRSRPCGSKDGELGLVAAPSPHA